MTVYYVELDRDGERVAVYSGENPFAPRFNYAGVLGFDRIPDDENNVLSGYTVGYWEAESPALAVFQAKAWLRNHAERGE